MIENNPFEPIEDLLIRKRIDVDILKTRKWTTCNFDYEGDLDVECYPLAWAHETVARLKNKKIVYANKKKFITLIWTANKNRHMWYNFIKKYFNCGYYNFAFKGLSNIKSAIRWEKLPKEYYETIWEFGIESGKDKPFKCITEKTYRPLSLSKPFLVYGHPGMYKKLQQLGFTLNPYIDYSFDEDRKNRWVLFCKEIERLIDDTHEKHVEHAKLNKKEFDSILNATRHNFERWLCIDTKI